MGTTILIPDIEGWAVCTYTGSDNITEVHGEHMKGCNREFDGASNWGWEWHDTKRGDLQNRCWHCEKPVPENIVAIVAMMNWEKLGQ